MLQSAEVWRFVIGPKKELQLSIRLLSPAAARLSMRTFVQLAGQPRPRNIEDFEPASSLSLTKATCDHTVHDDGVIAAKPSLGGNRRGGTGSIGKGSELIVLSESQRRKAAATTQQWAKDDIVEVDGITLYVAVIDSSGGTGTQYTISRTSRNCTACSGMTCGVGAECLTTGKSAGMCQCKASDGFMEYAGSCHLVKTVRNAFSTVVSATSGLHNLFKIPIPANFRWRIMVEPVGSTTSTFVSLSFHDSHPPLDYVVLGPVFQPLMMNSGVCKPTESFAFFDLFHPSGPLTSFVVKPQVLDCATLLNACDEVLSRGTVSKDVDSVCVTTIASAGNTTGAIEVGANEAFFKVRVEFGKQTKLQVRSAVRQIPLYISTASSITMANSTSLAFPYKMDLGSCQTTSTIERFFRVQAPPGTMFSFITSTVSNTEVCQDQPAASSRSPTAALGSVPSSGVLAPLSPDPGRSKWLILAYIAADNDLEYFSVQDLNEMAQATSALPPLRPCV